MSRTFALILVFFAALGLMLSPAAACGAKANSAPIAVKTADSACHGMTEAPPKPSPVKRDMKDCCKTMCAPAFLATESVMSHRMDATHSPYAPQSAQLAGLADSLDKPPPRTAA